MYTISGSTRFLIACLEKFGVESTLSITEYLHFYMQWEKHYALDLSHPLPRFLCQPLLFKVNCPVFGQSIIVALSGGYILYYIFLVYLAGMKNVATTACVPCTVLMGKENQLSRLVFLLLNCCPIVTLYSLVPRPPLLLPSVCVHNNTQKWSSAPVYYYER